MISFSVIVVTYNHAPYLEERIASVMAQTYPHFEVIFVDDASTDGSQEIIERYRHHEKVSHLLLSKTNNGYQSHNWQQAIEMAANDWIWIAEGDDVADPQFLEKAAEALSNGEKALFYTDAYKLEEGKPKSASLLYSNIKDKFFQTRHWSSNYKGEGKTEINAFHKYVCIVNNVSAAIIPRQPALEVLAHFPHKRFYSDWLFFAQLMERLPVVYLAQPLTGYRSYLQSHFGKEGNGLAKRVECFEILHYFCNQPYITGKKELVKFFTEQYLGFGLWQNAAWLLPLTKQFLKRSPRLAATVFLHLLRIKLTRKKIKYIF